MYRNLQESLYRNSQESFTKYPHDYSIDFAFLVILPSISTGFRSRFTSRASSRIKHLFQNYVSGLLWDFNPINSLSTSLETTPEIPPGSPPVIPWKISQESSEIIYPLIFIGFSR